MTREQAEIVLHSIKFILDNAQYSDDVEEALNIAIEALKNSERTEKSSQNVSNGDLISKKAAIDKFIDGFEEIFADLRERHGDDSVCGLCEYDGAYLGQSGDWCNECPGFEKDDCFKLSGKIRKKWTDEIIKALPSVQPEIIRCKDCAKREYCRTSTIWAVTPDDNWYCADAERKDND